MLYNEYKLMAMDKYNTIYGINDLNDFGNIGIFGNKKYNSKLSYNEDDSDEEGLPPIVFLDDSSFTNYI